MLKIRRPLGRLIFNMGIAIPGKTVFLIETAPSLSQGFLVPLSFFSLNSEIWFEEYLKPLKKVNEGIKLEWNLCDNIDEVGNVFYSVFSSVII